MSESFIIRDGSLRGNPQGLQGRQKCKEKLEREERHKEHMSMTDINPDRLLFVKDSLQLYLFFYMRERVKEWDNLRHLPSTVCPRCLMKLRFEKQVSQEKLYQSNLV